MSESIRDITRKQMYEAISEARVADARKLLALEPELRSSGGVHGTWLHDAAGYGNVDMLSMLIEEGFDVNAHDGKVPDGPLRWTLRSGHIDAARLLLDRGASPNVGRLLIGAINAKKNAFELVKLLVDRGADVNQCWRFGDEEHCPLFNALSWAIDNRREDIADFLRAHGAVMPPEEPAKAATNAIDEIVAYFTRCFGPVDQQVLREIVPSSDFPVVIHRIGPTATRNSTILFTTGMSDQPMNVPGEAEEYRFAELLFELPADWPLRNEALADLNHRWPIDWLRKVAAYPRQEQTWLGGLFAIMANSDPPTEFAPQYKFTSMLLAAGYEGIGPIALSSGRMIQVYTLVPLYEDERKLEQEEGLRGLFRRLDQFEIGRQVNRDRPSVASRVVTK